MVHLCYLELLMILLILPSLLNHILSRFFLKKINLNEGILDRLRIRYIKKFKRKSNMSVDKQRLFEQVS